MIHIEGYREREMQQHLMQMQPMMAAYYPSNVTTDHIQQVPLLFSLFLLLLSLFFFFLFFWGGFFVPVFPFLPVWLLRKRIWRKREENENLGFVFLVCLLLLCFCFDFPDEKLNPTGLSSRVASVRVR